jgi:DNA invertase Pin-like site-specific DNA recombinase
MAEVMQAVGRVIYAIYARLSQDRGRKSENTDIQIIECTEHIIDQGQPVDPDLVFKDNDLSASIFSTAPRPGWLDLLGAIREGRVTHVIITEVSRLCRNLADAIELVGLSKETPFTTVELTNGVRYDLRTVQGEHDFLEAVLDASRESGKSSVRLKRKKRVRAREGYYNGGSRPYGYRKPVGGEPGTLEPVPSEVAVVQEIYERLKAGELVLPLVADLNARGIPSATGGRWWPTTLMKLVTSPRIKGVRSHHGVEYPATWPAIVSPEDFERVQAILSHQTRPFNTGNRLTKRSYLLTGWAVCGSAYDEGKSCEAKLWPGAMKAYREVAPKRRYRCISVDSTGAAHGCGKVTRLADPLELFVSEAVLARYEGEDLAALVAPDAPEELHELAQSLGEDRQRLDQASRDRYRRKGDPLRLEEGQFLAIQAEIKDAMLAVQRRMARLEQGRALAAIPVGMTLRQAWDAADLGWRRTILSLVVVQVIVYPGFPGRRLWPVADSPLLERAKALGGPWCFDPSKVDIKWKL